MNFIKNKKRGVIFTLLCMVLLSCSILCYAFLHARVVDAYPSVSSTSVTSPIYDFENNCYNESALNEMAKLILTSQGNSDTTMNDLISYVTRVPAAGEAIKDKTLTLKYGRYRFTQTSASYNDLIWMPVYLSRANNGHSILTLYLAFTTTNKSTSQQEQGWFSAQGLYSDAYSIAAPSNDYGASHMRSISLGAVTPYAKYPNGSYKLDDAPEVKESNSNKFSNFIQGTDFKGVLYDDLVSPSQISWQSNEKFSAYSSKFIDNAANSTMDLSPYASNLWPNEAYGLTAGESGYYLNSYFNYATKTQYNDWQNDKVWLPSLTEVGNGDNAPGSTLSGIWELTKEQRSNAQKTWLRTAYTAEPKTDNSYSTYTMFCTDTSGKVTSGDVSEQNAIRPAIHLDLNVISGKTTAGISLPDIITVPYKREPYTGISDFVGESWYANFLIVAFYLNNPNELGPNEQPFGVNPVDAGEYYISVQINSSSDNPASNTEFVGGGKSRVIKFVIEKRKLKVEWNYAEDGVPINPYFNESDILEGDEAPKLGVYYKNITGGGDPYYNVYPDIKGHYRAYAYILDEEKYNYNYEIDGESYSAQFYVGERILPLPEFIYGPSDTISADKMRLDISYKGKSFVQIKNISKTMEVVVDSKSAAALESLEDLGWYEDEDGVGIRTYMVENVGEYTFTVILSKIDKENAIWYSPNPNTADITDKILTLNVKQAVITASFLDLPSSWGTNTAMSFRIGLVGVQTGDKPELNVYYQPARGGNMTTLKADANGVYTIPAGLNAGDYTVNAVLGNDIQLNGPYMMEKGASQKFTITQMQTNFSESQVTWKYTVGGRTTYLNEIGSHNTQSTAIELSYVDDYYQFTIQLSEELLKNNYQVRATYSGATYQKNAGSYSITVTISAYDSNVAFESQSYTVYFKINKGEFDVSKVKWDYTAPFKYTGNYCRVFLTNLPNGLAVEYTDNEKKDLGTYTATAKFKVLDEYKDNYEAPEDMSLDWEISESGSVVYPGEYNFTNLRLVVEHVGSNTLYLTWDESKGRWMNDGKEFVLSFPYDGELYTLRLEGEVDGLSFGAASNNSYRNAGTFTATFGTMSTNGNGVPKFDSTQWTIEKAELNFENVRWGYIDEDGNEFDRDFENSPFTFTRNENGAVKFKVGLIGLPAGVTVNYTVTCLTVKDSVALTGNIDAVGVSEAGVYQTSLNRNISFNDPNYVSITRIPDFIPSFLNWTIMEREFPEAKNNGSWTKFDNRIHNLMDIIGMTEADLMYFRVEIAFYNGVGKVINYYDGTNYGYDDKYDAISAGTYLVTFLELRGDKGTEYFWACIEIVVAKGTVRITWDDQGSIPVARVDGVYVSDIIGTMYYTADDDVERSADYVTSATSNGVKFYAVPYVLEKYAGDLAIENPERYDFEYEYFQPDSNSTKIDKSQISIVEPSFEFTGGKIIFNLSNYYFGYTQYLYYTGDSLEQTDIGVYHIDINFRKTANAYWDGTSGDRSTLRLTFEITSPSSIALDKPTLSTTTVTYDGKAHTLEITNWTILRNFISYEVVRSDGRKYGQAESLTDVGTYTIRFYFPEGSIGYWKSGGTDDCILTFTIKARTTPGPSTQPGDDNPDPDVPQKDPHEIDLPELIADEMEYNGLEVNIIKNWDDIKEYIEAGIMAGNTFISNDVAYAACKEVGTYTIYLRIKPQYQDTYYWADGTTGYQIVVFTIYAATINPDDLNVGSNGKLTGPNASGEDVDLSDFLDYKYYDEDGNEVSEGDLQPGKDYTVEVTLKPEIYEDSYLRDKFYDSFTNADEIKAMIEGHEPWSFTMEGTGFNRILMIFAIAEVIVLILEIIATIIVLLIQRKLYNTSEDEYDSYEDYEDYDDYDSFGSYNEY